MYGYSEEFEREMAEFEATYGFTTWYLKGGHYSQFWDDVVMFFTDRGFFPAELGQIQITLEGKSVTGPGAELLASGIFLPDGSPATRVGVGAYILDFLGNWSTEILTRLENILIVANSEEMSLRTRNVIVYMHDELAEQYNRIATDLYGAVQGSLIVHIPMMKELYGPGVEEEIATLPAYTVLNPQILADYANLLMVVAVAQADAEETVAAGTGFGLVADYGQLYKEKTKSKAWMWLLGGGITLAAIGGIGCLVARSRKSKTTKGYGVPSTQWNKLSVREREEIASGIGWVNRKGNLTSGGKKIARTPFNKLSTAAKRLIQYYQPSTGFGKLIPLDEIQRLWLKKTHNIVEKVYRETPRMKDGGISNHVLETYQLWNVLGDNITEAVAPPKHTRDERKADFIKRIDWRYEDAGKVERKLYDIALDVVRKYEGKL